MRRRRLLLAAATLPLAAATPPASAAAPLKVVASISVLGDMVQNVGGDRVQVATLVGPDGDPHAFEPRPADAKALATADLVVVNGLALEGWLDRLVKASGYKGSVVTAAENVRPREMEEGGKTVPDPHAWQDLANGEAYVRTIAAGLEAADPAGKADYERNAQAYLARLGAEDAKVRDEIARVPEAKRKVVTSHDAFGYFGAAYGVEFAAPEGISEDAEPSAADMRRLIEQIRREHVKVLFFESALSPKLVQQIGRETGARVGGTLYADALSKPGGPADTYLGMFEHNVPLLVQAMLAGGEL